MLIDQIVESINFVNDRTENSSRPMKLNYGKIYLSNCENNAYNGLTDEYNSCLCSNNMILWSLHFLNGELACVFFKELEKLQERGVIDIGKLFTQVFGGDDTRYQNTHNEKNNVFDFILARNIYKFEKFACKTHAINDNDNTSDDDNCHGIKYYEKEIISVIKYLLAIFTKYNIHVEFQRRTLMTCIVCSTWKIIEAIVDLDDVRNTLTRSANHDLLQMLRKTDAKSDGNYGNAIIDEDVKQLFVREKNIIKQNLLAKFTQAKN